MTNIQALVHVLDFAGFVSAVSTLLVIGLVLWIVVNREVRRHGVARSERRRARIEATLLAPGEAGIERELREALTGWAPLADLCRTLERVLPGDPELARRIEHLAVTSGMDWRLRRLIAGRDARLRGLAARAYVALGLSDRVHALSRLVDDPDLDVRHVACRGLASCESDEAVDALVSALQRGALARPWLLTALAQPWAAPRVLHHLEASTSPRLRGDLADVLGLIGSALSENTLLEMLEGGVDAERVSAARALASTGSVRAVPALRRALGDGFWPVRAQAATALGDLHATSALGELYDALGDRSWWVRANAAAALVRLGDTGLARLRTAVQSHPDRFARHRAHETLDAQALAAGLAA